MSGKTLDGKKVGSMKKLAGKYATLVTNVASVDALTSFEYLNL
jgi:hypothetical protein